MSSREGPVDPEAERAGFAWQIGVWDGISQIYADEIDRRFTPEPPVPGVGPGSLADPAPFVVQLGRAGIGAHVETETLGFDFPDFATAWEVLARVTEAQLSPERQREARDTVFNLMWPQGDGPRAFRNVTQFVVGNRAGGYERAHDQPSEGSASPSHTR